MKGALILALAMPTAAHAETVVSANGFVVENKAFAAAPPAAVWQALLAPQRYWNPAHSYSGKAENFTLEAKAGGCFCEAFGEGGSIEHMRVVMVMPERQLRLVGGLGPLQSEGLSGALTWTLTPVATGTEISQTYVVGGHMRMDAAQMAPLVGQVIGEQLQRLAATFPQQ